MNPAPQGITKSMDKVMKSMDLEKISAVMDDFEKAMWDSEVQAGVVNKTMDGTTTGATDQSEIEAAMAQARNPSRAKDGKS